MPGSFFIKDRFGWVSLSRFKPLVKVRCMLKIDLENILTQLWHPITDAVTKRTQLQSSDGLVLRARVP